MQIFTFSLAAFSAIGSFLFGYDSGVMTQVIGSKHFLTFFDTTDDSPILGAIVSTFAAGAVFGALSGGLTMDKLGRRMSIQIGGLVALIGAVLQAAASHLAMMLVGRIITGWAVGIMSMAVPVYQAECAHPKTRGLMVGLSQQMIGIGFIISTWVGYGSLKRPDTDSFQWRFPLAFQGIPAIILVIGLIFFPESPRQLMEKDREEDAMAVLRRLRHGASDEDINREFQEIKATIQAENSITAPGWTIMFQVPSWRKRLLLGTSVQVFTQLTGINVINYYQTIMYRSLGIEGGTNRLVTAVYNFVGPIANLIFIFFLIDRVGRKKPLIFGTVGITVLLIIEATLGSQNLEHSKSMSIAGVAMIFLVSIVFSWSFGPISWTYMSEIMPMQIRAKGNAFATGIGNWLFNVIFSQVSPQGLGDLGWKYYFVFVAFNICITLPCIIIFYPETKGLSLEEIDLLFGDRALGKLPADIATKGNASEFEHVEKGDVAA
ncbi:general substrate transporter [Kalaharituber pfeilii]|nr:general substrate transporter [Kalaharituber pfeilii]